MVGERREITVSFYNFDVVMCAGGLDPLSMRFVVGFGFGVGAEDGETISLRSCLKTCAVYFVLCFAFLCFWIL